MIRVLGIDIPRGWAVVDVATGSYLHGMAHGVAFGELDEGREVEHFAELVSKYQPLRVAIETPLEPYHHGRGGAGKEEGARRSIGISLISCAMLAGRIWQQSVNMFLPNVVVTDANSCRRKLGIGGRTRTEKDQAVKQYVRTHVRGWSAKSNTDERDACAVAIYGGRTN